MNGDADSPSTITARLPSGTPIKVEVEGLDSGDGMTSVGLWVGAKGEGSLTVTLEWSAPGGPASPGDGNG